jgi:hypothetical protein
MGGVVEHPIKCSKSWWDKNGNTKITPKTDEILTELPDTRAMNLDYPSTQQIPLRGRIERFGSVAALALELSQSGAVGILRVGRLELHISGQHMTHAVHDGLTLEEAAVVVLQIEHGNYAFFAQNPVRNVQFDVMRWALQAMQQLDETRRVRPRAGVVVLPSLKAALEYVRGLGGVKAWTAKSQQTGLLLERSQMKVLALGATLEEFTCLLPTL